MRKPIKILWIEDDPGVSVSGALVLQNAAMRSGDEIVLEVSRTLSGGIVRGDLFDVILLDLDLPDSPLEDTVCAIHSLAPALPPIIVLSGFTYPDTNENGLYWKVIFEGAEDAFFKTSILAEPARLLDSMKKAVLRKYRNAAKKTP